MKNIVNKFKQLSTKDKILSIILCIMIILFIHDIMKPIINNDNSSNKKENKEEPTTNVETQVPDSRKENKVTVKFTYGEAIKLTASEEYNDKEEYYSEIDDKIEFPSYTVRKVKVFDNVNESVENILYELFNYSKNIGFNSYYVYEILDEKYYNGSEKILDNINKYKTNNSFDLKKVAELLSTYNTNVKKFYDEINEGIDPESSEYRNPIIDKFYAYNSSLAYFYQKNIKEKNERKFVEKITEDYFKTGDGYSQYGIKKFYVTLYPVYLNDKFVDYYITYDVAYSEDASDKEIEKEYKRLKAEFTEKAELYPNSYTVQFDDYTLYKEYSNNENCYATTCINVYLNKNVKFEDIYYNIFASNYSNIIYERPFSIIDLEENKEYDIYAYTKKHYKDISNATIKSEDILKNIKKEEK